VSVAVSLMVLATSSLVLVVTAWATGASFGGRTVIVKVWLSLVSSPPLAVPPVSERTTVTVADPVSPVAGV
jgi:hypothetical protein